MLGYQMLTPSLSHGYSLTVTTSSNPTIIATVILPCSVWGADKGGHLFSEEETEVLTPHQHPGLLCPLSSEAR